MLIVCVCVCACSPMLPSWKPTSTLCSWKGGSVHYMNLPKPDFIKGGLELWREKNEDLCRSEKREESSWHQRDWGKYWKKLTLFLITFISPGFKSSAFVRCFCLVPKFSLWQECSGKPALKNKLTNNKALIFSVCQFLGGKSSHCGLFKLSWYYWIQNRGDMHIHLPFILLYELTLPHHCIGLRLSECFLLFASKYCTILH